MKKKHIFFCTGPIELKYVRLVGKILKYTSAAGTAKRKSYKLQQQSLVLCVQKTVTYNDDESKLKNRMNKTS